MITKVYLKVSLVNLSRLFLYQRTTCVYDNIFGFIFIHLNSFIVWLCLSIRIILESFYELKYLEF